jgi:hypothetical protein
MTERKHAGKGGTAGLAVAFLTVNAQMPMG